MWFLVEVQDQNSIGKNEQQRFLINEKYITLKRNLNYLDAMDIIALGTKVHPATFEYDHAPQ